MWPPVYLFLIHADMHNHVSLKKKVWREKTSAFLIWVLDGRKLERPPQVCFTDWASTTIGQPYLTELVIWNWKATWFPWQHATKCQGNWANAREYRCLQQPKVFLQDSNYPWCYYKHTKSSYKPSTCNQNIYILTSLLLQNRLCRNDSFVPANDQLLLMRRKRKFTGGSLWSRILVRHNKLSWVLVIEIFSQPGINFHHSNCLYDLREILVFPLQNEDGCGCWDEPQLGMPKSTGLVCPESWLH